MPPRRSNLRLNFEEIPQTSHQDEQNVGNFSQIPQSFTHSQQNMGIFSEIPQSFTLNQQNMHGYRQNFPTPFPNVQHFPDPSLYPNFAFNPYSMGNYYPQQQMSPPLSTPQQTSRNRNRFVPVDEAEDEVDPAPLDTPRQKTIWTTAEDEALISSYLKCSMDSVVGTNQKCKDLWRRVFEMYQEATLSNPRLVCSRKVESIRSRWRRLQTEIMQWVAVYDEAIRKKRSGMTEEEVIREANILYEHNHGTKFNSYEQWTWLRHEPKWMLATEKGINLDDPSQESPQTQSSGKRVRLGDDDDAYFMETPTTEETREVNSPMKRPMGSKKAKKKGKNKVSGESSTAVEFENTLKTFQETILQKTTNDERQNKWKTLQILVKRGYDNLNAKEQAMYDKLWEELN